MYDVLWFTLVKKSVLVEDSPIRAIHQTAWQWQQIAVVSVWSSHFSFTSEHIGLCIRCAKPSLTRHILLQLSLVSSTEVGQHTSILPCLLGMYLLTCPSL